MDVKRLKWRNFGTVTYVSVNQGHMMFAKRKLRQERIGWNCKIACKTSNASFEKWFMPILKHQLGCLKLLSVVGMKNTEVM
jgi:hypothetical protein